jgi:hypothetical protein
MSRAVSDERSAASPGRHFVVLGKAIAMSVQSPFSRAFLIATAERAVRSFAASLASLLTASGAGILDASWSENLSVATMAALVTVLFAIGGGTLGKGDGPSFVGTENLAPRPAAAAVPAVPAVADVTPAAEQPSPALA